MFGRKSKKKEAQAKEAQPKAEHNPSSGQSEETGTKQPARIHSESLGDAWVALTGINPQALIPQVVGTVLHAGGTRPPWKWKQKDTEYILMAWPADQPIRAAVLMSGPEGGQMKPVTAVPFMEGLPNDMTVEETHQRTEGHGGDVAVTMIENEHPMWFFDPLLGRDREDLTPGVTHTFLLSGLAFGIRKAVLDEITVTRGPQFEAWAQKWLADNPGKERKDVPPLKMEIKGRPFIMPGRFYGEYQIRATINKVQDCQLEKMPVKILYLSFPFENRPPMHVPLYVSQYVYKDYMPQEGEEIEAYVWMQGRIIDHDETQPAQTGSPA